MNLSCLDSLEKVRRGGELTSFHLPGDLDHDTRNRSRRGAGSEKQGCRQTGAGEHHTHTHAHRHTHPTTNNKPGLGKEKKKNNSAAQAGEDNAHPQEHLAERMDEPWQVSRGHRLFFSFFFFMFPGGEMSVQSRSSQDLHTLCGP